MIGEASTALAGAPEVTTPQEAKPEAKDRLASWSVTSIGIVTTLWLVPWLGQSIYRDEGASLYSARLSWSDLWAQSQHVDLVFLPYYSMLHLWIELSGSIQWMRTPSLLAFGGTVILVGRIGLRVGGRWCGIVTAVLAGTNALLIERALNARPYALSALAVTLSAAMLVDWLRSGRKSRLWLFALFGLVAGIFQVFAVLAPMAMAVGILAARPMLLRARLAAMAWPLVALTAASGALAVAGAGQVGQVSWIASESMTSVASNARGPAIGTLYDLALIVVAFVVLLLVNSEREHGGRSAVRALVVDDGDQFWMSLSWAVLPTLLLVTASIVHPVFWDRYATASAPGLALFVGVVSARALKYFFDPDRRTGLRRMRSKAACLAGLGIALAVLLAVGSFVTASTTVQDLQALAKYAAVHAQPGDEIVLPDHAVTAGVTYYLAQDGRAVALWPQFGVKQRYVEGFDLSLSRAAIASEPRRLWVVNDSINMALFDWVVIGHGYTLVERRHFTGVSLWLYRRTD